MPHQASLTFAVPGGLHLPTGGATYGRKVVEALRAGGWQVNVLEWPASFPFPNERDRMDVAAGLESLPDGALVMIDGLALGTLPTLARSEAARLRLVALVHHPLALEAGLPVAQVRRLALEEREALKWVRAVIVTSETTAATLASDYDVPSNRITVAVPGIERRSPQPRIGAPGPLRILSLGQASPRKAHHIMVEALSIVAGLDFSCVIAGGLDRYPDTATALARQIVQLGLSERVILAGEVGDEVLARLYAEADIFASASVYEGYGMALAEAMAWGLPVVATTGGSIPELVPPEAGLLVPPGAAAAFAEALRLVMTEAGLRTSLAKGARRAAERLGGWEVTAACIGAALAAI